MCSLSLPGRVAEKVAAVEIVKKKMVGCLLRKFLFHTFKAWLVPI